MNREAALGSSGEAEGAGHQRFGLSFLGPRSWSLFSIWVMAHTTENSTTATPALISEGSWMLSRSPAGRAGNHHDEQADRQSGRKLSGH